MHRLPSELIAEINGLEALGSLATEVLRVRDLVIFARLAKIHSP